MIILNLGCGTKASSSPSVVNIDFTIFLRVKRNPLLRPFAPLIFRGDRRERYDALPGNIRVHNLKYGIPYPDSSVDVVYHSHLFEHLDRDVGFEFLKETKRVLKPGGVLRICCPDLEYECRRYLKHLELCVDDPEESKYHDDAIARLLLQSVRREAYGSSQQRPLRRWVENVLLGDARKRGETHQWMYDKVNISEKLLAAGFSRAVMQEYNTSLIAGWNEIGLDLDADGAQYKPYSLYAEGVC
jgi:SAM-dependent methyltransferase